MCMFTYNCGFYIRRFWSGHAGTITHVPLEVLANGIISKVRCL